MLFTPEPGPGLIAWFIFIQYVAIFFIFIIVVKLLLILSLFGLIWAKRIPDFAKFWIRNDVNNILKKNSKMIPRSS